MAHFRRGCPCIASRPPCAVRMGDGWVERGRARKADLTVSQVLLGPR